MRLKLKKLKVGKEIPSVELLRGIASAMVCFFHLSNGNPRYLVDSAVVRQAGSIGWAGVEIFFVISGFIIPYAMFIKNYTISDIPVFLKKRIIRIEPPYLISIVLVIGLNFLSTLSPSFRGAPFSINWANLAGHVAYLNAFTGAPWLSDIYWTLAIEFQYYILIAVIFGLLVSGNRAYRLLFFVAFAATSFLKLSSNSFIFYYALYFLSGILLFQWVCGVISSKEFVCLAGITIALLVYRNGTPMALLVVLSLLIITYVNEVPAFLRRLGIISYSLYLTHIPIGGRVINLAETRVHSMFLRECIVFVAFFICIGMAAIFYKYIEKTFKRLSASISYHKIGVPKTKTLSSEKFI